MTTLCIQLLLYDNLFIFIIESDIPNSLFVKKVFSEEWTPPEGEYLIKFTLPQGFGRINDWMRKLDMVS